MSKGRESPTRSYLYNFNFTFRFESSCNRTTFAVTVTYDSASCKHVNPDGRPAILADWIGSRLTGDYPRRQLPNRPCNTYETGRLECFCSSVLFAACWMVYAGGASEAVDICLRVTSQSAAYPIGKDRWPVVRNNAWRGHDSNFLHRLCRPSP